MKIANKLTLYIFVTAAVFVPLLTAGAYYIARNLLETAILENQLELNRSMMTRIDRTIFRAMQDIQNLAGERDIETFITVHSDHSAGTQQWSDPLPEIQEKVLLTGPWLEVMLVNRAGRICYSTDTIEINMLLSERHAEASTELDAALQGATSVSDVLMAPETGQPTLVFATPVMNSRTGEVYGVMIGHYAWLVVQQALDELRPPIRAYLISRTSTVIAAQADRRQDVLVRNLSPVFSTRMENGISGEMVHLEDNEPPYLITAVPQTGRFSFRGHGWSMLMAVPRHVAHQPLNQMVLSLLVISTVVVLAMAVAVFILGRRMAAPIVTMKEAVQSIAAGDYKRLIPAISPDEIGLLSDAINRMAKDLLDSTVSRDYLSRIIHAMINCVIVIEPDGCIRSVNRAVLDLLKYRDEDLIGRPIGFMFAEAEEEFYLEKIGVLATEPPTDPLEVEQRWVSTIFRVNQDQIRSQEKQFLTSEGQAVPVLFSGAVLRKRQGDIEAVVCVAQDISDLKRAQEEIRQAQASLVQSAKLASIGELVSGVAHELNQPLMVLRGTTQLMARNLRKGALHLEQLPCNLESMDRNTKRMMTIINHLGSFSRQSDKELEPVRVNGVIKDCFLMIGEQLKLRDIAVETDLDPDILWVMGNTNQLEQVILNLVINARDAIEGRRQALGQEGKEMEPARIGIISRSGYEKDGAGTVEIWIQDNGSGISRLNMNRIFDPFFTTKPVGQGTGLGLSISYGIIKDHNGEISVAETGPEGTTFRIALPERG